MDLNPFFPFYVDPKTGERRPLPHPEPVMRDEQLGLSIRFIRQWKPEDPPRPSLLDVWLYQFFATQARWRVGLTAEDRAFLRDLRISPK